MSISATADIHYRRETSDHFDEHRKRRIADQILFVPRAARRQRDRAIEQQAAFPAPQRLTSCIRGKVAENWIAAPASAGSGDPEARPNRAGWSVYMLGCRRTRRGPRFDRRGSPQHTRFGLRRWHD